MAFTALGCHVFAGGFTMGVQEIMHVPAQLEIHNFGRETAESLGVKFCNRPAWTDWPKIQCDMLYGNPRCTGFSCMTGGYDESAHGPWSKPTRDVHDLCNYGVRHDIPVITWESVQQAYSTGRPLLDHLRDTLFTPRGYHIAHVFINAATFGNAQVRKRYFFVAYKKEIHFRCEEPEMIPRDSMANLITPEEGNEVKLNKKNAQYDEHSFIALTDDEKACVPYLKQGQNLNMFAKHNEDVLERISPKFFEAWLFRNSNMPFSMHCIYRCTTGRAPTLHSGASRFLHPFLDRPLTVGEISKIMGWKIIPKGTNPIGQIAKGVVPSVGKWLAQQVADSLDHKARMTMPIIGTEEEWVNDTTSQFYDV